MSKNQKDNNWLEEMSERYQEPLADLTAQFGEVLTEITELFPKLKPEEQEKRARTRLRGKYKRRRISPATRCVGWIFGVSPPVSSTRRRIEAAKQMWDIDQQRAFEEGYCNEEGDPIDNRATFDDGSTNPNYGEVLDIDTYLFNVFGVYSKAPLKDDDKLEMKPFTMMASNDYANPKHDDFRGGALIPTWKPVDFFGIIKSEVDGVTQMNWSALTEFNEWEPPKGMNIGKMLKGPCKEQFVSAVKLTDWFKKNKKNIYNTFVMFNCDALSVNPNVGRYGSWTLHIDDEARDDAGMPELRCFVPEFIPPDFGNDSRLLVCGRPKVGTKRDASEMVINIYGIHVYPKYRTERPKPEPVTAKSTKTKTKAKEGGDLELSEDDFEKTDDFRGETEE
jgi:hypothetical protein